MATDEEYTEYQNGYDAGKTIVEKINEILAAESEGKTEDFKSGLIDSIFDNIKEV